MTDDYLAVLAHEFAPSEGSFLWQMYNRMWDKAAFTRLTDAMVACCRALDATGKRPGGNSLDNLDWTPVPRWLADGFWFVSAGVRDVTMTWAETAQEQDYYDAAYERLLLLASWFFTGHSPYGDSSPMFPPL